MGLGGLRGLRGFQVAMVWATQPQGNAAGAGAVPGRRNTWEIRVTRRLPLLSASITGAPPPCEKLHFDSAGMR